MQIAQAHLPNTNATPARQRSADSGRKAVISSLKTRTILTQNLIQRVLNSFQSCHLIYSDFIYIRDYIYMCVQVRIGSYAPKMSPRCPRAVNSSKGWICPTAQSQESSTRRAEGSYPHLKLWRGCWTCHAGHVLGIPDHSACETSDDQTVESDVALSQKLWGWVVGTSGLHHTDYILANKLNVTRAVSGTEVCRHEWSMPILLSYLPPGSSHQRWPLDVVLLCSNSFTMQKRCLGHWYLAQPKPC